MMKFWWVLVMMSSMWVPCLARAKYIHATHPDIGPDTCGQDRKTLGRWFREHGHTSLILSPTPDLVRKLSIDPYSDPCNPPVHPDNGTLYCGMKWSEERDPVSGYKKYWLKNFDSMEAATAEGFVITHQDECAACSSLQDLGVFIFQNLTDPVRRCSLQGTFSHAWMMSCLGELGFSDMCLTIWAYNIQNTKRKCLGTCLWAWITGAPFNNPDGSLNKCLQCDEDKSGPNFKYFSGRTRRNSGIPSSIIRPSASIFNMSHCYWYGQLV